MADNTGFSNTIGWRNKTFPTILHCKNYNNDAQIGFFSFSDWNLNDQKVLKLFRPEKNPQNLILQLHESCTREVAIVTRCLKLGKPSDFRIMALWYETHVQCPDCFVEKVTFLVCALSSALHIILMVEHGLLEFWICFFALCWNLFSGKSSAKSLVTTWNPLFL